MTNAQAIRPPHRPLLIEGDRGVTLEELDASARAVASALSDLGVPAGGRVIVATPNRIEWFVVNRALGLIGALQISMNARFTVGEVAATAQRSRAATAIIDMPHAADVVEALRSAGVATPITVDDERLPGVLHLGELLAHPTALEPTAEPVEGELVVYTSGTSGRPKGALRGTAHVPADLFAEYVRSTQEYAGPRTDPVAERCVMVSMPLSHASGPKQVLEALAAGIPVVLQRRFDARQALELIDRHRVTDWHVVPVMLHRMLRLADELGPVYDLSSIRRLTVGGAPVPARLVAEVAEYLGPDVLTSGYGSTETGMVTGISPQELRERPTSCGRPFAHVAVEIRSDGGRQPLPAGTEGEIWVKTPRIIRGYLDEGPLGPEVLDARGFFRTGDLGSVDAEGYLYITGRRVDMIISGGVNVYPAEIEACLRQHPAVGDAVVVGVPDEEMGEVPVAFVELNPGASAGEDELLDFCRSGLARFKRPRRLTILDELPRNAVGKVTKAGLPAIARTTNEAAR
ncbi:class I adenylate-forming enzyme family protein [Dactylosporangium sp. CA-092794]|uniref:class I adenylate-forming enzyme family protein n=1 Tax=Dactylosporangium sp. CA-092794 TaxID=3239929 RepID=UPI003D8E2B1D